jgi:hypothetical protein
VPEPTYKIRRILKKTAVGVTKSAYCTLDAILKFDNPESPFCVYNEHVALRLAQTLHIPVADGALTHAGNGLAYASLQIDSPGLPLPDLLKSQIKQVANGYADHVGATVAFDIFIGNWDRGRNLKASLVTPHIRVFRTFDHEHALLNIESIPSNSISRLRSADLVVYHHPFYGYVSEHHLSKWVTRIAALNDEYIRECCIYGSTFRNVDDGIQRDLAEALISRKVLLGQVVSNNQLMIQAR